MFASGKWSLSEDASNGYEAVAEEFMAVRSTSGRAVVQKWAASLPRACSVVDVGAGSGEPLTSALIDEGLGVSAIDASPKMVAAFRRCFPGVEVACEPAELSRFFNRTFDAALAIGLIFLLPENSQRELIRRISGALNSGGRLLFSAPQQVGTWNDILTGQPSWSLGAEEYGRVLAHSRFRLIDEHDDEGGAHYYEAQKG
jgi:SAM-dependent methyltransferase